jgi:hypothetical protein
LRAGSSGNFFFFLETDPKKPQESPKNPTLLCAAMRGFFPGPKTSQNLTKPLTTYHELMRGFFPRRKPCIALHGSSGPDFFPEKPPQISTTLNNPQQTSTNLNIDKQRTGGPGFFYWLNS